MNARSTTTGTSDATLNASKPAPLAVGARDAARMLGIGTRMLWELTSPRGTIPAAKVGTRTLYPVDGLKAWLADQVAKGAAQ